jgi:hypothetical protein
MYYATLARVNRRTSSRLMVVARSVRGGNKGGARPTRFARPPPVITYIYIPIHAQGSHVGQVLAYYG